MRENASLRTIDGRWRDMASPDAQKQTDAEAANSARPNTEAQRSVTDEEWERYLDFLDARYDEDEEHDEDCTCEDCLQDYPERYGLVGVPPDEDEEPGDGYPPDDQAQQGIEHEGE